jgi:hypothetical protein
VMRLVSGEDIGLIRTQMVSSRLRIQGLDRDKAREISPDLL